MGWRYEMDWRRQGLERHDVGWRYIRWAGDMRWTGGDMAWRRTDMGWWRRIVVCWTLEFRLLAG